MTIALTIIGTVLVLVTLQDVFHTLFQPAHGDISDGISRTVWRSFRRFLPSSISLAGPISFVTIVLFWAFAIILGFALIYLPHLPNQFTFAPGLNARNYGSLWGALTLSLGSLITLSSGVYSTTLWIQILMGIESVFGFGLLTASVSWILSIYPVLEHKRSLAHQATLLHFSEAKGIRRLDDLSDTDLQPLLLGFASQLTTHRNELTQFPITYYFYEEDKQTALAGILPYLMDIAERYMSRGGGAGLAAATLAGAIEDYLKVIAASFLRCEFTDRYRILRAFAEDQMREIVHAPEVHPRAA
jgi:hypothetical protein